MKEILKQLRNERHLSLRQVGALLDLNFSTIACYETGKREPSIETLKKIAALYEVTLDYLCNNGGYLYCGYKDSNNKLLVNAEDYQKFINYFSIKDGKRMVNINEIVGIDKNINLYDIIKEFSFISKMNDLFDNKPHDIKEFESIINGNDVIINNSILNTIKDVLKK